MALSSTRILEALGSAETIAGGLSFERLHVLESLSRYWPRHRELIVALLAKPPPMSRARITLPPKLARIQLPFWAEDLGVEGHLCIPAELWPKGPAAWQDTPWLEVAFWFLSAMPEQLFADRFGNIHSQSERLQSWPVEMWNIAWVNRIALFLRRWAARHNNRNEDELFGPLPKAQLAVAHLLEAPGLAGASRKSAPLMARLFGEDLFSLEALIERGKSAHLREIIFLPVTILAGSKCADSISLLRSAADARFELGLSLSGDCPAEPMSMTIQRERVEALLERRVRICRSDAARLDWARSWAAAADAGFREDFTLGFVDRFGFRNSAAFSTAAWHFAQRTALPIQQQPFIGLTPNPNAPWLSGAGDDALANVLAEARLIRGVACIGRRAQLFGGSRKARRAHDEFMSLVAPDHS
ncbi:MAG TPA: hypothetical protein VEH27_20340 [Methylomirabilota bacterium]|nr:hypothetical protein [Methylomirabilota bacterium]